MIFHCFKQTSIAFHYRKYLQAEFLKLQKQGVFIFSKYRLDQETLTVNDCWRN